MGTQYEICMRKSVQKVEAEQGTCCPIEREEGAAAGSGRVLPTYNWHFEVSDNLSVTELQHEPTQNKNNAE